MTKTSRARYTLEFKHEAVRLVEGGTRPFARSGEAQPVIGVDTSLTSETAKGAKNALSS
jgi:hypothetical protein